MRKQALWIVTAILALTACEPAGEENRTDQWCKIDFESVAIPEIGYTYGSATDTKDSSGTYDILSTTIEGTKFDTWQQTSPWFFWWGWAISNCTGTEYQSDYSHQYASPVGAASGNNFAVCYRSESTGTLYTPTIRFSGTVEPSEMKITNSTTTLCYIEGTDGFSSWSADDKTTLHITGYIGDVKGTTIDVVLAEGSSMIEDWTAVNLTPLGKVDRIELSFSSTDTGEWGMNAPAYVCIDDITYTK